MNKRIMSGLSVYALVLLAVIALVVGGCAAPAATPLPAAAPPPAPTSIMDYTVKIMSKAGIGDYLVDAKGMTLYYFTKDTLGQSNATSAILQIWPIFNVANFVLPSSLNAADFGTITTDGQQQATYKGWPLYYYAKDIASGDTLGQGVNDVWFVANPEAPMATSPTGKSINLNSSRSN